MAKARKKKIAAPPLRNLVAAACSDLDHVLKVLERSRLQDLLTEDGEQLAYLLAEARRQLGTAKVMYLEADVPLGWTR